jgi:hypothetical protein
MENIQKIYDLHQEMNTICEYELSYLKEFYNNRNKKQEILAISEKKQKIWHKFLEKITRPDIKEYIFNDSKINKNIIKILQQISDKNALISQLWRQYYYMLESQITLQKYLLTLQNSDFAYSDRVLDRAQPSQTQKNQAFSSRDTGKIFAFYI